MIILSSIIHLFICILSKFHHPVHLFPFVSIHSIQPIHLIHPIHSIQHPLHPNPNRLIYPMYPIHSIQLIHPIHPIHFIQHLIRRIHLIHSIQPVDAIQHFIHPIHSTRPIHSPFILSMFHPFHNSSTLEQILEENPYNGFPVVEDTDGEKMLAGFITRRDVTVAIRESPETFCTFLYI